MRSDFLDKKGRPLVAVTGMGIVTSLGRGKEENWSKLVAGQSGIRQITRFPTEGLRTTIAGTVEGLEPAPQSAARRTMQMAQIAAEEAIDEFRLSRADFPGPLFVATPPAEIEWQERRRIYEVRDEKGDRGYRRLSRVARSGDFRDIARDSQFASVAEHLANQFGTQGLAVLGFDGLRLRCNRNPARRRGDQARRDRVLRFASAPIALCNSKPLSGFRFSRRFQRATRHRKPHRDRSRAGAMASSWPRAQVRSFWSRCSRRLRVVPPSWGSFAAAERWRTTIIARAPSQTAQQLSGPCNERSMMRALIRRTSTTSMPTARAHQRTTRWSFCLSPLFLVRDWRAYRCRPASR